jgi:RNA polymerase sigma-70 factor (ECF subfamily)
LDKRWDLPPDPLEALRKGDPAPFEAFVAAETASFRAFFSRLGASVVEAEDLTQELFLKMFRHAPSYTPRDRFAPYAFRVARNAWIDHCRRQGSRPRPLGFGNVAGDATGNEAPDNPFEQLRAEQVEVGHALENREQAARVRLALAGLPENQRLVFELGVIQELDYPTIAGILEIPVGTVKSRMFYAVRRLRECCEEDGGPDVKGKNATGTAAPHGSAGSFGRGAKDAKRGEGA